MIEVRDGVNELELIVVLEKLKEQGVQWATVRTGNGCVWVSRGRIEEYYIFSKGRLVDIQID